MRVGFAFIILLAACAAGCLSPVLSLYPLVEEEHGIAVPEIVGTWGGTPPRGDSTVTVRFDLEHGARYTMTIPDSADSTQIRVLFARLGGRLFADMVPDPESIPGGDQSPWLWPMHLVYRVDIAGDSLRLAFLDDAWVKRSLASHHLRARHEQPGEDVVLTEKTAGLQAMVRKIANVDAAFDTSATFLRRR